MSALDVSVTDSGTDPHSKRVSPGFSKSASFPRPKTYDHNFSAGRSLNFKTIVGS